MLDADPGARQYGIWFKNSGQARVREYVGKVSAWVDRHRASAWAVMALCVAGITIGGLPGLPRDLQQHAGDPLGIQAFNALAKPNVTLDWLTGPSIDERSYRPLCMLLHRVEFNLWSTQDKYYLYVSTILYVANTILLAALTALLARGPLIVRLAQGFIAATFLASPYFRDSTVAQWMLNFWPSQSDGCALFFSLCGLILLLNYLRGRTHWMLAVSIAALAAGTWFKEIGYIAMLAGCLLALSEGSPARRRRAVLAVVVTGGLMWCGRSWALHGNAHYTPPANVVRFLRIALPYELLVGWDANWSWWAAGAGLAVTALLRKRYSQSQFPLAGGIGAALLVAGISGNLFVLFLLPSGWQPMFAAGAVLLIASACVVRLRTDASIRTVLIAWVVSCYIVSPFKVSLGWYRYWPQALWAVLVALALPMALTMAARLLGYVPPGPLSDEQSNEAIHSTLATSSLRHRLAVSLAAGSMIAVLMLGLAWIVHCTATDSHISSRTIRLAGDNIGWQLSFIESPVGNSATMRPTILLLPGEETSRGAFSATRLADGLAKLGYIVLLDRNPSTVGQTDRARLLQSSLDTIAMQNGFCTGTTTAIGWGTGALVALRLAKAGRNVKRVECIAGFLGAAETDALVAEQSLNQAASNSNTRKTQTFDAIHLYVSCAQSDWPRLRPALEPMIKQRSVNPQEHMVFVPHDAGPIFPNESAYWKRSLDSMIEFLFRNVPPTSSS